MMKRAPATLALTGVLSCSIGSSLFAQESPVQWLVEDGGNGRWYQLETTVGVADFEAMQEVAESQGGYLTAITSLAESEFIALNVVTDKSSGRGALIGAFSTDPANQVWAWVNGEPWGFTNWYGGEPKEVEDLAYVLKPGQGGPTGSWDDTTWGSQYEEAIIEWSADCNGDGIVDYGQILDGTLADDDADGVPDCCEASDCPVDADLNGDGCVNGADLSTLLGFWGVPNPVLGDLDGNGIVNGQDLAILLGNWSPCP